MYLNKLKKLHYKELFVFGSFISIIALGTLGTVIDLFIGSDDFYIDIFYTLGTYIIYRYSYKLKNIEKAAILLFWISTLSEIAFLFINRVDFDLIFALLIPIIAFVSFSLKQIIINLTLFYIILISTIIYFYFQYPNHLFLHNFKYMFGYFLAHAFIISYGFFYHLGITESIKRLEESNRLNRLLLKEIHHRVKNNLNLMASILGLQEQQNQNRIVKEALADSRSRIESMALLHEILYKNDKKENLNIKEYINKLIKHIINSESSQERVKTKSEIDSIYLTISSMIQFGIMLNEMITNSIKYAKSKNGIVQIDISFKKADKGYIFTYNDNGKNINLKKLQSGFGFKLIELTIEQLNGKMELENKNGLSYKIYFKELESI